MTKRRVDYDVAVKALSAKNITIDGLLARIERLRAALQRQIDSCDGDCVMCDDARAALEADAKAQEEQG